MLTLNALFISALQSIQLQLVCMSPPWDTGHHFSLLLVSILNLSPDDFSLHSGNVSDHVNSPTHRTAVLTSCAGRGVHVCLWVCRRRCARAGTAVDSTCPGQAAAIGGRNRVQSAIRGGACVLYRWRWRISEACCTHDADAEWGEPEPSKMSPDGDG